MPGAGVRTNITPRMGSKVETLWQAALTTDLKAQRLMKQNRFLIRFAFLLSPPCVPPMLPPPLPFPSLPSPLRHSSSSSSWSRDSAPTRPAGKEGWRLPPGRCLDSPSQNLRPRDQLRRLAAGEGALGRTGLRPGGLQTPRG